MSRVKMPYGQFTKNPKAQTNNSNSRDARINVLPHYTVPFLSFQPDSTLYLYPFAVWYAQRPLILSTSARCTA